MFVVLGVALAGVAALYGAGRWLAGPAEPAPAGAFAGGLAPAEHATSRFHVRWYAVAMVFLAFDMEMLFMYPWAVVVAEVGAAALRRRAVARPAVLLATVPGGTASRLAVERAVVAAGRGAGGGRPVGGGGPARPGRRRLARRAVRPAARAARPGLGGRARAGGAGAGGRA
ncbi:NADH-quinone oxidoreductase subunit A [Streptomyces mayteni]